MTALPVADAARALGISPSTLRRWCRQGCPVVQRGRRGRGGALLVDAATVRAWRSAAGGDAAALDFAAAVPELLAGAMEQAFLLIDGPFKRSTAGVLAGVWELASAALTDYLRTRCADVPQLGVRPLAIQRLRQIHRG